MAAIGTGHFAVTISRRVIMGKARMVLGTLTLTGGSDTYSTGGMPLPAISSFGFVKRMDALIIYGGLGTETVSYEPRYTGSSTHKLQIYASHDTAGSTTLPMDEQDTSEAPGTRVWYFVAFGW